MHFLLLFMMTAQSGPSPELQQMIRQIAESGRVTEAGETPDKRVAPRPQIAPGAPPLLSFRYFEGKQHHRFGDMDLVLDDAGH
jgi:hypothetical protein